METKKQFKYFHIMEYDKEQLYLQEIHRQGWKLVTVTGLCIYHFEKCEPEDVVYQLDYNQEGIAHKAEYIQMFQDCGWEYLIDYAGYSYFRKPTSEMNENEEIFCDDQSRLDMVERIFKGRMIPVFGIFFALLIPQFILNFATYHNYSIAILIGACIILYIIIFIEYATKYFTYKKHLNQ